MRKSLWCHRLGFNSLVRAALVCAALVCAVPAAATEWPRTDFAPDPAIKLGVLPNGMRYAILKNQTPAGAVSVRLSLAVGSTHEARDQRGFSHFVEHMAFRGSKNFPDGEINRSLERFGSRYGADTNASTGQNMTLYMFDLPTADPAGLADALAITRDIAGNVSFAPSAVETEAGVILSESAMRGTPSRRAGSAQLEFQLADPRASAMPGSDPSIIQHPSAPDLLRYYRAYYRPERAILTIVGDVDPDQLAAQITARFADWRGVGESGQDPVFKVPTDRGLEARIHVEAGVSPQIALAWIRPPFVHPVDRAGWKDLHISAIAFQIANRRLAALGASPDHPFINASAGQQDVPRAARLFTLSASGEWQKALTALAQTRLALLHTPVSQAEIDFAVAAQKAGALRAEMSADSRASSGLASFLAANAVQGDIAVSPAQQRAATDEDLADINPETVGKVLSYAFSGDPLIFVSTPSPLNENERGVIDAYRGVTADAKVTDVNPPSAAGETVKWTYADFGPPGRVVETQTAPDIGITSLRFANNVRLLVRPSKLRLNQVLVSVRLGDGRRGLPKDRAASWLFGGLAPSGLGALSATEIVTALSGKNCRIVFSVGDSAFTFGGETTSRDLETQLQLFAAYIKDPGFRTGGFEQFRQQSVNRLRTADTTPAGVMGLMSPAILHGGDKRWAAPTLEEIRTATVGDLQALARPALADTPMEVIITGDTTVDEANRAVAATLGALPSRPDQTLKVTPDNDMAFPSHPAPVVLQTSTSSSQGLASIAWATQGYFTDLKNDAALHLLAAILRERLLDAVRGQGLSYAVQVAMPASSGFDYGYISATATMPAGKAKIFYDAADKIVADLKAGRIDADEFERARAPTLQDLRRSVQTNDYWMGLLNNGWDMQAKFNRARSYDRILESVTLDDVAAVARKYLTDGVRITAGS